VIGALCALGGSAATASGATWTGETHGKLERSSRLVSGGTTWHGSFSFTTDRRGAVRGQAVIAYEPRLDLSGLNNAIGYIRSYVGTTLSVLGPFGSAISGVGLSQILGASVSFRSAMAIRRGTLTGSLRKGRLTLRMNGKLPGIPYDTNLVLATAGSKRIDGGRAGIRSPFTGAGDVVGRRMAVHSSENRSKDGGVTEQVGSYWMAHRTG
jgi:hypothetical protein